MAKELTFSIDRQPYLLGPDRPAEGEPRRLFDGETETDLNPAMRERARGVGLTMRRPRWLPNTVLVHEATLYAKEQGLDGRFHHVAAAAFWEDGADLGRIEVIRDLAEPSGLDWAEMGPRLELGHYRPQVWEEYQAARDLGITGTPTYGIAGELHWGDLSVDQLRSLIKDAS